MGFFAILSAIVTAIVSLFFGIELVKTVVNIVVWAIYGAFAGTVARFAMTDFIKINFWQSIGVGIAGSFIGGFLKFACGYGFLPLESSGIVAGCLGSIVLLYVISILKKPVPPTAGTP